MTKRIIDTRDIPQANGFYMCECSDPECGPHFIISHNGKPLVQAVVPLDELPGLIKSLQGIAYSKKAMRDD